MTVVKWDPFKEFGTLHNRLGNFFGAVPAWDTGTEMPATTWTPTVDILESGNDLIVKAELPRIEPKDVMVTVDNNVLFIKGERRFSKETEKENYHRIERAYGNFSRSFALPTFIDETKVKAEFKNGVLTITVPKKETAKSRGIEVKVA